jgi:hypothetical protein
MMDRGRGASEKQRMRNRVGELADILGSGPETRVTEDYVATTILEVAQQDGEPPLITVGSRGLARMRIRHTRLGASPPRSSPLPRDRFTFARMPSR